MDEESAQKEKERARLERVLLWALMSLKKEDFPAGLQSRYLQIRSLASGNGKLTSESIRSLSDDEVEDLWSVVEDLLESRAH
jgi:hypothetical protein